nr:hypothetical protein [uncultured Prevotella sp.]
MSKTNDNNQPVAVGSKHSTGGWGEHHPATGCTSDKRGVHPCWHYLVQGG